MKLKKAIKTSGRTQEPSLNIGGSGAFSFNKKATANLDLIGKSVDFFQDEESPESWYFTITKDGQLKLREYKEQAMCNASSVAYDIKESTKNDPKKSLRCKIGNAFDHEGTTLYPLLIVTGSARSFSDKI